MANPNELKTQRKEVVPVGLNTARGRLTGQWLLHDSKTRRIYPGNRLDWYVCGQEGFAQIAADIEAAKDSIDLVCWGFDPGMALVRSGPKKAFPWAGGEPYGELLKRKAALGVKVRLLVWYDPVASAKQNNLIGYVVPGIPGAAAAYVGPDALARRRQSTQEAYQQTQAQYNPLGAMLGQDLYAHARADELRDDYCVEWWRQATSGHIPNLQVRCRKGTSSKVQASVAEEKNKPSSAAGRSGTHEKDLIEQYATHHQKPILIDYAYQDGAQAVGYVMGLNSVTDYWDTASHTFNDPLREQDYRCNTDKVGETAGQLKTAVSRKPLRDYAARIQGQALIDVHDNFATAWNAAQLLPQLQGGGHALKVNTVPEPVVGHKPGKLFKSAKGVNLQVLRTQPEHSYADASKTTPFEKSIKHAYFQASSFALNYLYLENQYFFYEEWAQHVQANRQAFMQGLQGAGKNSRDAKTLHLLAVIPAPEEDGMVARTYDTLKALGQGSAMPGQRTLLDNSEQLAQEQSQWDQRNSHLSAGQRHSAALAGGARPNTTAWAKAHPKVDDQGRQTAGDVLDSGHAVVQDSRKVKEPTLNKEGVLMLEGKSLGLKTLVVKLVSKNQGGQAKLGSFRDIYIHSKLMMTDDSFATLGSANLNLRSMAADSEINIATDDRAKTAELRKRVWGELTGGVSDMNGGDASPKAIADAYKQWKTLAQKNKDAVDDPSGQLPFTGHIVQFEDKRAVTYRYG